MNDEEEREPEDEAREKEEGWYDIREEKVTEEGTGGQVQTLYFARVCKLFCFL